MRGVLVLFLVGVAQKIHFANEAASFSKFEILYSNAFKSVWYICYQ
jgi:hypothetical protein